MLLRPPRASPEALSPWPPRAARPSCACCAHARRQAGEKESNPDWRERRQAVRRKGRKRRRIRLCAERAATLRQANKLTRPTGEVLVATLQTHCEAMRPIARCYKSAPRWTTHRCHAPRTCAGATSRRPRRWQSCRPCRQGARSCPTLSSALRCCGTRAQRSLL